MDTFDLPDAPAPQGHHLTGHENLEIVSESQTGIEALLQSEEGYIVGRLNNELLRFKTDAHFLTVSPTGGGKTSGIIIPNLLDHPGSAVVIDIRGETVAKTATARRLQGQRVVVLDPYQLTKGQWGEDSYNPFDRFTKDLEERTSDDRIQRLVNALMFDPSGRMSDEPIWDNATRNLLTGLITLCVRYWPSYRHNLLEILDTLNLSSDEMKRFINELSALIQNDPRAQQDRQLKGLLRILTEAKSTTKVTDNALVQAQTLLTWVGNRSFQGILDDSTFSFSDLQESKTTVYLVVPEEYVDNCAIWIRLMIESAIFSLSDVYQSKGISTIQLRQRDRVLFLLDELAAFGQLDVISKGMATLRGRGVNLWLFVQNLAQLEKIYGKEDARTIIGNAAALQAFKSNELEELEYFTRLIGEEFYDVQTVSVGETLTEGASTAKGASHTISNSESISNTTGTADTVGEATSISWGESFGKTKNKSLSINNSYASSHGASSSNAKGRNKGIGGTYQRNLLSSTKLSENDSSGSSTNTSQGRSRNETRTKGSGTTVGEGSSYTQTKGGSKTTSHSKTVNESTTYASQQGTSDTTSETVTHSESKAANRNVSVKRERMKIETVRTLREKMSGRNQLLQVRGYHPFFSPRMSYFVKFMDVDRYMFPDMAAMVMLDNLSIFSDRHYLSTPLEEIVELEVGSESYTVTKFKGGLDKLANAREIYQSELKECQDLISNDLSDMVNELKSLDHHLLKQREAFGEVSLVLKSIVSIINELEIDDFFSEVNSGIVNNLQNIEDLSSKVILTVPQLVSKYQKLPIMNIKTDGYRIEYTRSSTGETFRVESEDIEWVVRLYLNVLQKFLPQLENDVKQMIELAKEQEKVRVWIKSSILEVQAKLSGVIQEVISRENDHKHAFFMQRHALD